MPPTLYVLANKCILILFYLYIDAFIKMYFDHLFRMRMNQNTYIYGRKVALVPYRRHHVPKLVLISFIVFISSYIFINI